MRLSEHVYAPRSTQPRHAHAEASVSIVLAGALRERVGRREELARALSVVVKPVDTEHADEFGPAGVRLVRITLLAGESAEVARWAAALRQWRWTHGGPSTRAFLALVGAMRSGVAHESDASARLERLAWDALAALDADDGAAHAGSPPRWLALARAALDDAMADAAARGESDPPPRLTELAALTGVHPVYLARQFRRHFGCSVSAHIHRLRVRRAAELMGGTRLALSQVAAVAGFTDQPHLCRVFRRETGLTPGAYRALTVEVPLVQDLGPRAA